ncbi:cadherin domain-containing protein [Capilliphycus salinus ALCB114379]|uniref:choice-of-anchor Y domain-containing protein n=1 Tax=Capilliphycus salinus TaxID=2768948 RepID=UPI0039A6779D
MNNQILFLDSDLQNSQPGTQDIPPTVDSSILSQDDNFPEDTTIILTEEVAENQAPSFIKTLNLYENLAVIPDDSAATANGSWLAFGSLPPGFVIPTANGTSTTFDTTEFSDLFAGYGNYNLMSNTLVNSAFPTLNRNTGYTLNFSARVVSEDNTGSDKNGDGQSDRAGFSVTVISSDGKKGIELGFENDKIWAQEDGINQSDPSAEPNPYQPHTFDLTLFTQAESAAFDTTSDLVEYDLKILGETYTLSVDGNSILSGSLRDYTAFKGRIDPYELPNFIFLGDNTPSAQAEIELGSISITTEANNTDYSFELPENAENGLVIGQVPATDSDGDSLTYNIISGSENNIFGINSNTGEITLADNSSLDFETQPTAYSLTIEVSDNSLTDTITVGINVTDIEETTPKTPPTENPPTEETPPTETPQTEENPPTETPGTETPGTETPSTETPPTGENPPTEETPPLETPGTENPQTEENPPTETPPIETPGTENPQTEETPQTEENPPTETPPIETPQTEENPSTETPTTGENPSTETPTTPPTETPTTGENPSTETPTNPPIETPPTEENLGTETPQTGETPGTETPQTEETPPTKTPQTPGNDNAETPENSGDKNTVNSDNFGEENPKSEDNTNSDNSGEDNGNNGETNNPVSEGVVLDNTNTNTTGNSNSSSGNFGNENNNNTSETNNQTDENTAIPRSENFEISSTYDPTEFISAIEFPSLKPNSIPKERSLEASTQADNLQATSESENLFGFEGDDNIYATSSSLKIFGNRGNDYIEGQANSEAIYGGRNNDQIKAGNGNDTLFGDQDNDIITGENGDDIIYGNSGNDTLEGAEGNDTLYSGQDNDFAKGGVDNDLVFGDIGNDIVEGNEGNDTLYGNSGIDTISGNDGDDFIYGGQGNDLLDGNNGSDTLFGDFGDDTLDGGAGDDSLIGGDGNDWLVGASGNDTLIGGEGSDRFYISSSFDDNFITDFADSVDKIALTGGLTFDQLEITSDNGSTLIKLADSQAELATLLGIDSNLITSDDFLIG